MRTATGWPPCPNRTGKPFSLQSTPPTELQEKRWCLKYQFSTTRHNSFISRLCVHSVRCCIFRHSRTSLYVHKWLLPNFISEMHFGGTFLLLLSFVIGWKTNHSHKKTLLFIAWKQQKTTPNESALCWGHYFWKFVFHVLFVPSATHGRFLSILIITHFRWHCPKRDRRTVGCVGVEWTTTVTDVRVDTQ